MKNKKLNIGIMIDQLVSGGVQKSAIQEAKELEKLGHNVVLYVLVKYRDQSRYQFHDLTQGLKIVFLSDSNPWLFRYPIRIPYFAFLTNLHILNPLFVKYYKQTFENIDFIVSHGTTTCITASAISKQLKIPYMAFIYDPMEYILEKVYGNKPTKYFFPIIKFMIRYYERSFLNSAALVITQSGVHKGYLKNTYQVDPIIIYPACVPPKKIIKHDLSKQKIILGYTRWELAKNPIIFLWLAKKLPNVKFLIAGTWPNTDEKEKFLSLIDQMQLNKQVTLLSDIKEHELKNIAQKSLAWIHPHIEAFGLAGLEMASLGLPIIIPRNSGVTELFIDKKHGIFPKTTDKKEYLEIIQYLLDHPKKALSMGNEAARISRRYTWKNHSKSLIQVIQTYLSQTKVVCIANGFVSKKATGGGDHFIIELLKRVPNNFHITLILPSPGYYHIQSFGVESPNLRCIVLPQNYFDDHDYPIPIFITYMLRAFSTLRILKQLPPFEILHTATDLISDSLPAFLYQNSQKNVHWISRFFHFVESPFKREGDFWINSGSYLLQRLSLVLLRNAEIVMIDNPNLKTALLKKGIRNNSIMMHTGGVDFARLANGKKNSSVSSDAVFIGRLIPHKGIFDALIIWKEIVKSRPQAKLNIIGYGPNNITIKIQQLIKQEKLQNNIFLRGFIIDKDIIASYLCSSKLLLFLDHEAGFGLVIPEAMAAGLPTISYDLPIFGSVYKKGFLTAPLKDTGIIVKNILQILSDKNMYKKYSEAAQEQAEVFDWSYAGNRFYKNIKELAQNSENKKK